MQEQDEEEKAQGMAREATGTVQVRMLFFGSHTQAFQHVPFTIWSCCTQHTRSFESHHEVGEMWVRVRVCNPVCQCRCVFVTPCANVGACL